MTTGPLELQLFIDSAVKPALFSGSTFVFEIVLLLVAAISAMFYILAVSSIFVRKKKARYKNKELPFVSVQIPTFNELVAVRCAERCLNFDYPKNRYEIIIGDDSSDPNVSSAIDAFAAEKGVEVVRRGTNAGYKAGNLNSMLLHSKGDIIVIFDSDFVPKKDFLKKIVAPFADGKVGGVQSRWGFINAGQNLISGLGSSVLMIYHYITLPITSRFGISFLCGSAEAVRKDLLIKLGGWQDGSLTEDTEFSMRLLKAGYKNIYLEELETEGEVPFTFSGLKKQQKRWAFGTTKVFLQNCRTVLFGRFSPLQKFLMAFVLFGFVTAPLLALLFVTGTVAFVTNTPGPIDAMKLVTSVGRNLFLTSGFIAAGFIAMAKARKLKMFFPVLFSSLTIGIVLSFFVSKGFFRAFMRRPMEWYMIQKRGNDEMALLTMLPKMAGKPDRQNSLKA